MTVVISLTLTHLLKEMNHCFSFVESAKGSTFEHCFHLLQR